MSANQIAPVQVSDATLRSHFINQYYALTGVDLEDYNATLDEVLEAMQTAVNDRKGTMGAPQVLADERNAAPDVLDEPVAPAAPVTPEPAAPAAFDPLHPHCPECGKDVDQTWANEGVSMFCHCCSTTYSSTTGKKINAGFTRPNAPSGYTIQKDRPEQNGVKRQSAGSVGDKLWTLFDTVGAALDIKGAKEMAEAANLSATSATIAFYNWKKFNGFTKAAK